MPESPPPHSDPAGRVDRNLRAEQGTPPPDPAGSKGRPAGADPESLLLFGVPIHNVSESETLEWIVRRVKSGEPCQIVTSNLDFIRQSWKDPEMHRIHLEADLVVADGMPLVWFSRYFGPRLKERVAGSDLVPRLAETARDHGLSMYAVGAAPGVAEQALELLRHRHPGLRVAGWESPPLAPLLQMDHEAILARVHEAKPDVLLVAFGAPKQDKWIRLHSRGWQVPVAIGVGGSLDFLVGTQIRAPRWMQKTGLEWFWRMALQPRRMFKRYVLDFFFLLGLLFRLALLRRSPAGAIPEERESSGIEGAGRARLVPLARPEEAERFHADHRPNSERPSLVLDLAGARWLNSLELGLIARLARDCRKHRGRLVVQGVRKRVERLIRMLRLDEYLVLPEQEADLERLLAELRGRTGQRHAEWTRVGHRLLIALPVEFESEDAVRTDETLRRQLEDGGLTEVVVDGEKNSYIDSAGALFLQEARRQIEERPNSSVWIRGLGEKTLLALRKEGLGSIQRDRRAEFRKGGDREEDRARRKRSAKKRNTQRRVRKPARGRGKEAKP